MKESLKFFNYFFTVQNPVGNRIVLLIMDVYRLAKQVYFHSTDFSVIFNDLEILRYVLYIVSDVQTGTVMFALSGNHD